MPLTPTNQLLFSWANHILKGNKKGVCAMLKKLIILPALCLGLTACFNLPSPQDTQPTEKSKCAAIRAKMMQVGSSNNTPTAVSNAENINYRELYHEECE